MEYESGQSLQDGGKGAGGFEVKEIYKHFGVYCNFYSDKIQPYGDTIVIREVPDPRLSTELYDSSISDLNLMPYGATIGFNYIFPFRLSVYAGMGMAKYRIKRMQYDNMYFPSNTGWNDNLIRSEYSETVFETERKIMVEVGVDYDLIPSPLWACSVRMGYNTATRFSGQLMIGFNFGALRSNRSSE